MKKKLTTYLLYLLLPVLTASCLYEHPELTEDGELGVDPTAVNITAELSLNLKLGAAAESRIHTRAEEAPKFRHRIIVDAYLNRELAARQVLYKELTNEEEITATVDMKLHARDYQLVVWADYISTESESDLYYNTTTLAPVIGANSYKGNSDYKDVLYASHPLNLSQYRNQWNTHIPVELALKRPVARYELVADDVKKFLKKITDKEVTGKTFTVNVRYTDFFYTGFNALDEITKHALQYISYSGSISAPTEGMEEMRIAFDYVFVPDSEANIPISVEVKGEKDKLIARTYLLLSCTADEGQTIRSNFLTADPSGGVGFDPDYDDEINDKIEIE